MADPGFPTGGRGPVGGRGPPTQVLFGKNVCENEGIGSRGGRAPGTPPDLPMVINLMTTISWILTREPSTITSSNLQRTPDPGGKQGPDTSTSLPPSIPVHSGYVDNGHSVEPVGTSFYNFENAPKL